MANVINFANSFMSYLLLFAIIVLLVALACFIGIKWRKAKDAKAEELQLHEGVHKETTK